MLCYANVRPQHRPRLRVQERCICERRRFVPTVPVTGAAWHMGSTLGIESVARLSGHESFERLPVNTGLIAHFLTKFRFLDETFPRLPEKRRARIQFLEVRVLPGTQEGPSSACCCCSSPRPARCRPPAPPLRPPLASCADPHPMTLTCPRPSPPARAVAGVCALGCGDICAVAPGRPARCRTPAPPPPASCAGLVRCPAPDDA